MLEETSSIIAEELNVKAIEFSADEDEVVYRSAKPNFKVLGPKLGKLMKEAVGHVAKFTSSDICSLEAGNTAVLTFSDGSELEIGADDLTIQRKEKEGMTVANEGGVTIALDTKLSRELEEEGFAREFVSRVQNLRKDMDFEVSDRIVVKYSLDSDFKAALVNFEDYICNEVLAVELCEAESLDNGVESEINQLKCMIEIKKAN
jgi:isoleucyl-tRNA synthetase